MVHKYKKRLKGALFVSRNNLLKKCGWKCILLFATHSRLLGLGYAVYSVVGGWFLGDYGWVFGGNPYGLHSQYGSGRWTHFLEHLPTLLGWEWHQIQQRGVVGAGAAIAARQQTIAQIYNTSDPAEALESLRGFGRN